MRIARQSGVSRCAVIVGVILLPGLAAAQLFTWRDQNGTWQVTNRPPGKPAPLVAASPVPHGALGEDQSAADPPSPPAEPADPVAAELARREARLASREQQLAVLRASLSSADPNQLRLENLLQDDIAAEHAAIDALRRRQAGPEVTP